MTTSKYNNHILISSLRSGGYKVSIRHKREKNLIPTKKVGIKGGFSVHYVERIQPKGGETSVFISKDNVTYSGLATCRHDEFFCKKEGVSIALGRALETLAKNQARFVQSKLILAE